MSAITIIGLILGVGYFCLLSYLTWRWISYAETKPPTGYQPVTNISVLIAAKNEAHNLSNLTASLLAQNYPSDLVEFILINDHSTDKTVKIWDQLNLPSNFNIIHSNTSSGKKMAISLGVKNAKHSVIATTDADCTPNPNWLKSIAQIMENKNIQFLAGPVQFHQEKSLFEKFQSLDFLGMMLITGVGINQKSYYMANGANMAFQKSAFEAVNGYEGNAHIASGDDMFLVHKIAHKFPKGSVLFNKYRAAMVSTKAEATLKGFINQRVRWGSKNKASKDVILKGVLLWVLMTALWLVVFPWAKYWWMVLLLKLVGDFILLNQAASFFERKPLMKSFLPAFLMHTLYIAGIGFISLFWRGQWK